MTRRHLGFLLWGTSLLLLVLGWALANEGWLPEAWRLPGMALFGLSHVAWGFALCRPWLMSMIAFPPASASPEPEAPKTPTGPLDPSRAGEPDSGYAFPINRLPEAVQDIAFVVSMTLILALLVRGTVLFIQLIESAPDWTLWYFWAPLMHVTLGYVLARWEIIWRLKRQGYAPPDGF
jgi:hypothetical protein